MKEYTAPQFIKVKVDTSEVFARYTCIPVVGYSTFEELICDDGTDVTQGETSKHYCYDFNVG